MTIGDGGYRDVDGSYAAWFEKLGANILLVRPDFHVFGVCDEPEQVTAMVTQLADKVQLKNRSAA